MGAWIMIGLLAADIILQLSGLGGNVQWDWHEVGKRISYRMFQTAVDQANPAAAYHMRRTHKLIRSEYVPSPEDLEAVAEENSAALLEDMVGENSEAVRAAEAESKTNTAESETGTEYVETLAGVPTGEIYSEKALMDPDFLLEHFYTVDPTTSADSTLINGGDLLEKDMTIDLQGEAPKILIYHTHSQEGYADSEAGNTSDTVVGVGEQLKKYWKKNIMWRFIMICLFMICRMARRTGIWRIPRRQWQSGTFWKKILP